MSCWTTKRCCQRQYICEGLGAGGSDREGGKCLEAVAFIKSEDEGQLS